LLPVLIGWGGTVSAAVISFSGQLDVLTDVGGARYSGVTLGQLFSGSFSYGTEAQASTDPLAPGDYDFSSPPFGGSITDGTTPTSGSSSEPVQVTVNDDVMLDQDTADLLNSVLGTSLGSGSVVDIADIDTAFVKPSGGEIVFGLSFVNLDAMTWTGLDFANFPPESGNIDRAIFFIAETDASDTLIFEGFGELDSVVVPLPAALWLFAGGLMGLAGTAIRRRTGV
jgi:hypothetical protein